VPILGLAISGGGYVSEFTGTGALRALDARLESARQQRTGDLLQSLTYMSGLSGGSFPSLSFAA
jgi:lysophospholipase